MNKETQDLLREYWSEQRKKNDMLPEFDRLTDSYKMRIAFDIEFKKFRHMKETRKQPMQLHSIETSEAEANEFTCNWQGQTEKPTKVMLWRQVQAIEQVITVLRREQATLQTQIDNHE